MGLMDFYNVEFKKVRNRAKIDVRTTYNSAIMARNYSKEYKKAMRG